MFDIKASCVSGFEMTSGVKNFIERNRKKRAQVKKRRWFVTFSLMMK